MTAYRDGILLAGIAALLGSASPAFAHFGTHPRRLEVNGRLYNQERRINAGVRGGQLTHQEAHQLRSDDRGIYREERQMAKLDHGISRAPNRSPPTSRRMRRARPFTTIATTDRKSLGGQTAAGSDRRPFCCGYGCRWRPG